MISSLPVAGAGRSAAALSAVSGRRLLLTAGMLRASCSTLLEQVHGLLKHVVRLRIVHLYFLN